VLQVQLTPSVAQAVVVRSICIKKFIRLLGEGSSLDQLIEDAQRRAAEDPGSLAIVAQDSTFAFKIDTIYGKTDRLEQTEIINRFAELPFRGSVEMTDPARRFVVIRDMRVGKWFFGLQVAHTREGTKRWYNRYMLTKREYLGPTSTDTEQSFLMCNQVQITSESVCSTLSVGQGASW
jgi:tRNA G10  N-methylase Trm11